MINKLTTFFKVLFFVLLVVFLVWQTSNRPRVLIVQSYTTDFSWTRDVDIALRQVLNEKLYNVRYYYMDTKKHSDSKFKKIAGSLVRKQIDDWSPNVLIAVDDNAQSLVSTCFVNIEKMNVSERRLAAFKRKYPDFGKCYQHHPEMMVIYSGIGATPEDYGFTQQSNIGGITERMDIEAISDTLAKVKVGLNKSTMKVISPVDNSTSTQLNVKTSYVTLANRLEPLGIEFDHKVAKTFDDWQKNIQQANEQADILLFALYHTVKCSTSEDAKQISSKDLLRWTLANTTLPAIGAWGFFVEDGGRFSIGVSPFEQGSVAAQMAVDYLEQGIKPGEQKTKTTEQSIIYMREGRADRQGFTLPIIYQNFARATDNYIRVCDNFSAPCEDALQPAPDLVKFCES